MSPTTRDEAERPLLEVEDLHVRFGPVRAVDGVAFALPQGPYGLGVVGESGSGKTTIGRAVMRLVPLERGAIRLDGKEVQGVKGRGLKDYRRAVQIVFVRHHPSFAGLQEAVRLAGTTAQQRLLATARLQRAARGATGGAATVLRAILDWDGSYVRSDADGKLAPGVAAWQVFKEQAQGIAVGRLGKPAFIIGGGEPNNEHVYDVSLGQAYALRTLSPEGYRRAAKAAFAVLTKQFGSSDPSAWRDSRHMFAQSSLGAEQPPPMPFFDRGTYEDEEQWDQRREADRHVVGRQGALGCR